MPDLDVLSFSRVWLEEIMVSSACITGSFYYQKS